jgi:hypothetical protein
MQEAYAICQEVLAESPSDDAVIHPLRLTLVRLGRGTRDANREGHRDCAFSSDAQRGGDSMH